jgi:hypothetical protein
MKSKKWHLVYSAIIDDSFCRNKEDVYKRLIPRINSMIQLRDGISFEKESFEIISTDGKPRFANKD